jgi:hypothetical protein
MAWTPRSSFSFLFLPLAVGAIVAACGGNSTTGSTFVQHGLDGGAGDGTAPLDSGTSSGGQDGSFITGDASGSSSGGGGDSAAGFDVEPSALQTITVTVGQPIPTVVFQATDQGQPVTAGWSVDRGNLATINAGPSTSGTVTPTGTGGGLITVTAGRNGVTLTRQVFIKLVATQNGPTTNPGEVAQIPTTTGQLSAGGGVGGVGGEGLGAPVTDPATITALGSPSGNGQAQGLAYLYPYDKTVWPRGLLAPLIQWTWSTGNADAILMELSTTSGSYTWRGTFGPPPILMQTQGAFIRMPIPQDVWTTATETAGGPTPNAKTDQLTLSLVVAKSGVAYGPITETWTIAPALLDGIIYYQSYGTQLVQNYSGAVGGNGQFGGAVLSIHVGDSGPKLVAGTNAMDTGCRVCHSVAAEGSALVVQHGDSYSTSSDYNLGATPATETVLANSATSAFPAMYPDGSKMLTEQGQLYPLPMDPTATATTGLTNAVTDLGTPAFSPDGQHIAFNPLAGSGVTPENTLYTMTFDGTNTFAGLTLIAQDTAPARPGWPAFFPDSNSVVYHHQTQSSAEDSTIVTRNGAQAQIYWTSLKVPSDVTPLNNLNGVGYLPKLATPYSLTCGADGYSVGGIDNDHSNDVNHNYEPTVNPVAAGGYAWVVFTSRRMYGNEAIIPPYCSDPRGVNLAASTVATVPTNITTKKLWVAAVDLSQAAGVDSSHPAFYLPGQELIAGNSRGFWVLDPCQANGTSCSTGDQCCDGYCEQGEGGLVCGNKPPNATCSAQGDKCTSNADCCLTNDACIGGFCEQATAQ